MWLRSSHRIFFSHFLLCTFLSPVAEYSLQMGTEMYHAILVPVYQTTRRHILEGSNPHSHLRDNQKPQNLPMFCTSKYRYLTEILCRFSHLSQLSILHVHLGNINLLKPTGYVMHQQFNIQQLYVLPTLYLCVLYLSENKQ